MYILEFIRNEIARLQPATDENSDSESQTMSEPTPSEANMVSSSTQHDEYEEIEGASPKESSDQLPEDEPNFDEWLI